MAETINDTQTEKTIIVEGNGGNVSFPKSIINLIPVLSNILEDVDDENQTNIPCPNIDKKHLLIILLFAKTNKTEIESNSEISRITNLTENEKKFLPTEQNELFELLKVCNFLGFDYMVKIIGKHIGILIRESPNEEFFKLRDLINGDNQNNEDNN